MRLIARCLMWVYYTLFEVVMKLIGEHYQTAFKLGDVLGTVRYRLGYIGRNRSKEIYLKEMAAALPGKSQKE
ncbi:MAG: hypothetical protein HY801_07400 [Candidatus Lindowbacteria bacterium]|nr:hypothetical protein [Candidatus Lindowbacteria bacterium]